MVLLWVAKIAAAQAAALYCATKISACNGKKMNKLASVLHRSGAQKSMRWLAVLNAWPESNSTICLVMRLNGSSLRGGASLRRRAAATELRLELVDPLNLIRIVPAEG